MQNELTTPSDVIGQVKEILDSEDKTPHVLGFKLDHKHDTLVQHRRE